MSQAEHVATIDGVAVYSMTIPWPEKYSKRREKPAICPLCQEEIKGGTNGRFLGCNHRLFPNVVCHPECIERDGGYQAVSERLKEKNDRFKTLKAELIQEFGVIGWINGGESHDQ